MSYAAPSELALRYGVDRLVDLTDGDGVGLSDDRMIAAALVDASAEIDGYLSVRYQLPLPKVPALLGRLACDMAIYRLLGLRRMGDIEDARKRYEDARRLLEGIASGKVALGLPAALPEAQRPGLSLAAAQGGPAATFGRTGMGGW